MKNYLNVVYSTWKQVTQNNNFNIFHVSKSADVVEAWSGNREFIYKVNIDADNYIDWSGSFGTGSTEVSSSDDAIARIYGLSGLKSQPRTSDGKVIISASPPEQDSPTVYTHDWTDPTTWYYESQRVVAETASNSGDNQTYNLANNNIIDVYHGKLFNEDQLVDSGSNSYRVQVAVNGTASTEQDPHYASGGDYTVNYISGSITFLSVLSASDEVVVTYHYENGSGFWVIPDVGKKLKVKDVEAQFSEDIAITDTVIFQTYGYVEYFAPHLTPVPFPAGTLIPLRNNNYKTLRNFIDDANGSYPAIPALGSGSWRGLPSPIITFPWKYQAVSTLEYTKGMRIKISLEHDVPFSGSYSTATLYCLSEDE